LNKVIFINSFIFRYNYKLNASDLCLIWNRNLYLFLFIILTTALELQELENKWINEGEIRKLLILGF
jgi:hypothetical protein